MLVMLRITRYTTVVSLPKADDTAQYIQNIHSTCHMTMYALKATNVKANVAFVRFAIQVSSLELDAVSFDIFNTSCSRY